MARKRKTLPKTFAETLKSGDHVAMRAVFDTCLLDATGGYTKHTALGFSECDDTFTRWLVKAGADLGAMDTYGKTPLHLRAGRQGANPAILIELGADPNAGEGTRAGTPLHAAAMVHNIPHTKTLLQAGAHVDALNTDGNTPLTEGIRRATGPSFPQMTELAETLLAAGAIPQDQTRRFLQAVAKEFEFHRSNFNPDTVGAVSAALSKLYDLIGVAPAPKLVQHDGISPITLADASPVEQFEQLWQSLVPSNGAAATVQGEVIRLTGRILREIDGNGRINWDADFTAMATALEDHLASDVALPNDQMARARVILSDVKHGMAEVRPLRELALAWVAANPTPRALPPPPYAR